MTVIEKSSRKLISGSGWANPLSHNYELENASYVHVYADDEELVLGVDYTVTGVGEAAGYTVTINTPGAWPYVTTWVLDVVPPVDQRADVSLGGTYGAKFEDALDTLAGRVQFVYEQTRRSIKAPIDYDTSENLPTVDPETINLITNITSEQLQAITDAAELIEDLTPGSRTVLALGGSVQSINTGLPGLTVEGMDLRIGDSIPVWGASVNIDADGTITPAGDPWPGDGVTDNAELIIHESLIIGQRYQPLFDGGVAAPYWMKFGETASIMDFLPTSERLKDEPEISLEAANDIVAYALLGGKTLLVPKWFVLTAGSNGGFYGLQFTSLDHVSLSIVGNGSSVSGFKVADGADIGPLAMSGLHGVRIRGIGVDGNRANQTLTGIHGFRVGGDCEDWDVDDFMSINANGYGVGLETNSGGDSSFRFTTWRRIKVYNCRNDGFDTKNPNYNNHGNRIDGIEVIDFNRSGSTGEIAGIDCRGEWDVSNVYVELNDPVGLESLLRFRRGDAVVPGGDGSWSTLNGFNLRAIGSAGEVIGLDMEASSVVASNGSVRGVQGTGSIGVYIIGADPGGSRVTSVTVLDCATGFGAINDKPTFTDCVARRCTNAHVVGTDTFFFNFRAESGTDAVPVTDLLIIAGKKDTTGITGTLWNPTLNTFEFWGDGAVVSRYETGRRFNISAFADADFANPGLLQAGAGSSNYALSAKASSTSPRRVISTENPDGVQVTAEISSAGGLVFQKGAGASKLRIGLVDLPTSASGLPTGAVWNDSGTLKVV